MFKVKFLDGHEEEFETLAGANLRGAYLDRADLSGANLEGANLEGANLQFAYMLGTNMQGAKLCFANLSYTRLEDADLRGGRPWTGPTFFDTQFCSANLSGVDLRRVDLGTTDFRWSNLTDAQLNKTAENADLEGGKHSRMCYERRLRPQ